MACVQDGRGQTQRMGALLACPLLCLCALLQTTATGAENHVNPIVIAHRGASGYLPEHTLPAKALAHGMGADFLEQDVVLSRDGVPVVLHDIHLDRTTDVASVFPERARADGRFYAIDFDLAEIRQLRAHERRGADGNPVFPDRFPAQPGLSGVPTLNEEFAFIRGLNESRGTNTGIYVEMKNSAFHDAEGHDLPAAVLAALDESGWTHRREQVFLQSFEPDVLRRLRFELKTPLPLIQLIGENDWGELDHVDYGAMRSKQGLAAVASYADGIGPWLMQIYQGRDERGTPQLTNLVQRAQAVDLLVHPYTFRADQLPPGIDSFAELHRIMAAELGVDGLFTDFPDLSRRLLDAMAAPQ